MLTMHARQTGTTTTPRPVSHTTGWLIAWPGLAALGVANGALRELTYQPWVGERTGHQVSTVTLLALIAGYAWWLQRRWSLMSGRQALTVGAAWAAMTIAFEFSFGHYVAGSTFAELWADYDFTAGRLWVLVPLGIALAPLLARQLTAPADDPAEALTGA